LFKSKEEALLAAKKTIAWLDSDEGKQAMQDAIKKGTPFSDKIARARRIDPALLRIPLCPFR